MAAAIIAVPSVCMGRSLHAAGASVGAAVRLWADFFDAAGVAPVFCLVALGAGVCCDCQ